MKLLPCKQERVASDSQPGRAYTKMAPMDARMGESARRIKEIPIAPAWETLSNDLPKFPASAITLAWQFSATSGFGSRPRKTA